MTTPSCPHSDGILEAATDPERLPLGADAVAHLESCPHCRELVSDIALVDLFTRRNPAQLPAHLEEIPKHLLARSERHILRGRASRRVAAALLFSLAFFGGRWSSRPENSPDVPPSSRTLVVRMASPKPAGLFSKPRFVIESTRSPRGFLAALKPQ